MRAICQCHSCSRLTTSSVIMHDERFDYHVMARNEDRTRGKVTEAGRTTRCSAIRCFRLHGRGRTALRDCRPRRRTKGMEICNLSGRYIYISASLRAVPVLPQLARLPLPWESLRILVLVTQQCPYSRSRKLLTVLRQLPRTNRTGRPHRTPTAHSSRAAAG